MVIVIINSNFFGFDQTPSFKLPTFLPASEPTVSEDP